MGASFALAEGPSTMPVVHVHLVVAVHVHVYFDFDLDLDSPSPETHASPTPGFPPEPPPTTTGPSDVIFPTQKITLRFNHKFHITKIGLTCESCHSSATTATRAAIVCC